ncbi:DUF4239 domain-containing protein [Microbacterium sp. B2969]|uniref:DUF4239 domain-containing protein n=1 Tax=Microbacterium alkaliflavum TaxID=3248839 RepID=A0ABW7QEA3_9MICO
MILTGALPLGLSLTLFVGGFVLASCLIVVALRPVVRRHVDDPAQWDRVLGHVIGSFGVFFGILLALVAVSVYQNYTAARQAALREAGQITALYRGTTGLPEQVGGPIQDTLKEYLRVVIEEDWPNQRRGALPEASTAIVDELERQIYAYEPVGPQQAAEFSQLLSTFDDFVKTRRERIDATVLELPTLFWVAIWVGAAVNAVLIGLIIVKSRRLHLVMAGMLALFIGLVIFATADMDRPYQGSISVGPGPFERVMDQLEHRSDP